MGYFDKRCLGHLSHQLIMPSGALTFELLLWYGVVSLIVGFGFTIGCALARGVIRFVAGLVGS